MLSLQECLDYCDLIEDEISLIAHHEHLGFPGATQLALSLVQNRAGEVAVRCMLEDELTIAAGGGKVETLYMAQKAYRHFTLTHPDCLENAFT
ncbi:MAG: hypothetical protein JSR19_05950 [Proteobacteria bacterium]|nr:hypothetical protein [Pseudomonadota bacterium]HQR03768.1 hypothetical protein [Rhodocyclaceae bacterium]